MHLSVIIVIVVVVVAAVALVVNHHHHYIFCCVTANMTEAMENGMKCVQIFLRLVPLHTELN